MAKQTKKQQLVAKLDGEKIYSVDEALATLREHKAKFDETVEVAMNLGVDPRHADQMVRGMVSLPSGTGKDVKVAVFAKGDNAEKALAAGADKVGQAGKDPQILNGADARFAGAEILGAVGRDGDEAEGRKIVRKRYVDDGAALAVERDMALPQQHGAEILARQAAEVAAPAAAGAGLRDGSVHCLLQLGQVGHHAGSCDDPRQRGFGLRKLRHRRGHACRSHRPFGLDDLQHGSCRAS